MAILPIEYIIKYAIISYMNKLTPKEKNRTYTIMVNDTTRAMIKALAEKTGAKIIDVIRVAIADLYEKEGNTTDER